MALIDRCLIAVERGGAAGLICANKVDLLTAAERRRELRVLLGEEAPKRAPATSTAKDG